MTQLEIECCKLKNRQRFIGLTNKGRCVRCICIKLKTGMYLRKEDWCVVTYFEPYVFSLERLDDGEEVVGIK